MWADTLGPTAAPRISIIHTYVSPLPFWLKPESGPCRALRFSGAACSSCVVIAGAACQPRGWQPSLSRRNRSRNRSRNRNRRRPTWREHGGFERVRGCVISSTLDASGLRLAAGSSGSLGDKPQQPGRRLDASYKDPPRHCSAIWRGSRGAFCIGRAFFAGALWRPRS